MVEAINVTHQTPNLELPFQVCRQCKKPGAKCLYYTTRSKCQTFSLAMVKRLKLFYFPICSLTLHFVIRYVERELKEKEDTIEANKEQLKLVEEE